MHPRRVKINTFTDDKGYRLTGLAIARLWGPWQCLSMSAAVEKCIALLTTC